MDLFYTALSDDEPEVQCNAAFASGLLIEHSDVDLSPQYLQILAALRPIFVVAPDSPSSKLNARDNAVGAVARMIVKNTAAIRWCTDGDKDLDQGVTTAKLTKRDGPGTKDRAAGSLRKGAAVMLVCKLDGPSVKGNQRWYYTSTGDWVSARYVHNKGAAPRYCR